ncbi:MAG: hypothetical protein Q4G35_08330 [Propionibacteriaceae bacterium]|nr:hypothetical protein [Propionibacteriaceae bacterium]
MSDPRDIVATPTEHAHQLRDAWLAVLIVGLTALALSIVLWGVLT